MSRTAGTAAATHPDIEERGSEPRHRGVDVSDGVEHNLRIQVLCKAVTQAALHLLSSTE